jgi:hypothetical protein
MTSEPLTSEGESNGRFLIAWALISPVVFAALVPLVGAVGALLGTVALTVVALVWLHDRRQDQRLAAVRRLHR